MYYPILNEKFIVYTFHLGLLNINLYLITGWSDNFTYNHYDVIKSKILPKTIEFFKITYEYFITFCIKPVNYLLPFKVYMSLSMKRSILRYISVGKICHVVNFTNL